MAKIENDSLTPTSNVNVKKAEDLQSTNLPKIKTQRRARSPDFMQYYQAKAELKNEKVDAMLTIISSRSRNI